jgi:Cu/Ag efflux protein CusF
MIKKTTKSILMTAAACGALAFSGGVLWAAEQTGAQPSQQGAEPGQGQGQQGQHGANAPTGSSAGELSHATAMVTGIDRSARTVTLKKEDGEVVTVDVPADVKAFDRLKVGDRIDIDFYESLAIQMLPPGSKPSASERQRRSMTTSGGTNVREMTVSAQVVSVDPAANKVTFKGPRGRLQTITVQDPQMQQKLPSLKPGQVVQFTYTDATAASIRPATGQ